MIIAVYVAAAAVLADTPAGGWEGLLLGQGVVGVVLVLIMIGKLVPSGQTDRLREEVTQERARCTEAIAHGWARVAEEQARTAEERKRTEAAEARIRELNDIMRREVMPPLIRIADRLPEITVRLNRDQ